MTDLTGYGTLSYNGITFSGPRLSTFVEVDPEYDKTGRHIIAQKYTIYVRYLITSDEDGLLGASSASDTTDAFIPKIQRLLEQAGGELVFNNFGHGSTFEINTSDLTRDHFFGPHPGKAKFTPVGANLAVELDWSISVRMLRLVAENKLFGASGNVRSITYGVVYDIDATTGLTVRTVTGEISIILNRNGGSNSRDVYGNADQWRHLFNAIVPQYFRRTKNQWTLSEDKTKVSFLIIDAEMPSEIGLPPGMATVTLRQNSNLQFRPNSRGITGSFSGNFTMVRGFGLGLGWDRILLVVRERVNRIRRNGINVIIVGMNVTETIYETPGVEFTITYLLTGEGRNFIMDNFVKNSAFFSKVTTTSYAEYAATMSNTAWHQRGLARLEAGRYPDRLIDPTDLQSNARITLKDNVTAQNSYYFGKSFANTLPTPAASYIYFRNWIEYRVRTNKKVHRLMNNNDADILNTLITPGNPQQVQHGLGIIVQSDGSIHIDVWMKGRSRRIGYKPEVPRLASIWGKKPQLVDDGDNSATAVIGSIGNLEVHERRWKLKYIVTFRNTAEASRELKLGERISIETDQDPVGFKLLEHRINNF